MSNTQKQSSGVVTRMAPSPTGMFHVGGVRTLLYNYFFAKQHGGKFIIRIEDTDKERSEAKYEQNVLDTIKWLGIEVDEIYRQSDHLKRHQELIRLLVDQDKAYFAEQAQKGEGQVVRFRNPNKKVIFNDMILGELSFDTTDLGDFVIARDINSPLYHLGVVIDDSDEGVTTVIRAQEHLTNTPRQILLIEALGLQQPKYAHIPFILGPDGKKKLSKRDGEVSATEYRDKGYLPEAMINFLSFIGWNPGGEQELFEIAELIELFDIHKVQKGPAGFNIEKLQWLNKQYIKKLDTKTQAQALLPYFKNLTGFNDDLFLRAVPTIVERLSYWQEAKNLVSAHEFDYLFAVPAYDEPDLIAWKKSTPEMAKKNLEKVYVLIKDHDVKKWSAQILKEVIWPLAEEAGKGDVLWPLRYALSGQSRSPDPFTLLEILGNEKSLERISNAIHALSS